jgi:pyruvate/2-oxoglutarate dehydrogenase complex dihydrolipoamide acyltransferase (E2) component
MAYAFKLPDLGEGLTEGEIARWLVTEGQEIAEDDPLVEIQTDKTTVEIPSPAGGTVAQILAAEGAVVPVGTVIVVIDDGSVAASPPPAAAAAAPAGHVPVTVTGPGPEERVRATPVVRRIAGELGVDLASVRGTGPGGRITEDDVRGASGHVAVTVTGTRPEGPGGEGGRQPLRGVRRLIADQMTRAHTIPAVTWVEECDFTDVDLQTLVARVVKACSDALGEYPELNARLDDDAIVFLDRHDVGVAVQTEQGLVVPVVRDVAARSVEEIDQELRRLADAARAGTLKTDELRDSTFTVTSAGKLAGLLVTPLINHPNVAILGVHRIEERAVVRDGQVTVRKMGNISVTFDHRVVDGARAAAFGLAVISRLR